MLICFPLSSMLPSDYDFIEVYESPIHGRGVFARQRIDTGEIIIEYKGELLSSAEIDERYADERSDDRGRTYIFHLEGDLYVDATKASNPARFINHSCAPNCEAIAENGRILIRALKDIEPGDELTYDYSLEIEEEPLPDWREIYACRCGAESCRGTMLAEREFSV
jgi:SET domain-containing protein